MRGGLGLGSTKVKRRRGGWYGFGRDFNVDDDIQWRGCGFSVFRIGVLGKTITIRIKGELFKGREKTITIDRGRVLQMKNENSHAIFLRLMQFLQCLFPIDKINFNQT